MIKQSENISFRMMIISMFLFIIPVLINLKIFLTNHNLTYLNHFLDVSINVISFVLPFIILILIIYALDQKVKYAEFSVLILLIILNYFTIDNQILIDMFGKINADKYYQITTLLNGIWLIVLLGYLTVYFSKNFNLKFTDKRFMNIIVRVLIFLITAISLIIVLNILFSVLVLFTTKFAFSWQGPKLLMLFLIAFLDKLLVIFQNIYDGSNIFIDLLVVKLNDVTTITEFNQLMLKFKNLEFILNSLIVPMTSYFIYRKISEYNQRIIGPILIIAGILAFVFGINQMFFLMLLIISPQLLGVMSLLNGITIILISVPNKSFDYTLIPNTGIYNFIEQVNHVGVMNEAVLLNLLIVIIYGLIMYLLIKRTKIFNFGVNSAIISKNKKVEKTKINYSELAEEDVMIIIENIKFENIKQINLVAETIFIELEELILISINDHLNVLTLSITNQTLEIRAKKIEDDEINIFEVYQSLVVKHYNYQMENANSSLVEIIKK